MSTELFLNYRFSFDFLVQALSLFKLFFLIDLTKPTRSAMRSSDAIQIGRRTAATTTKKGEKILCLLFLVFLVILDVYTCIYL